MDQGLFDPTLDEAATIRGVIELLERRRRARVPGQPPCWLPALAIAEALGIRAHGSDDSRKRGVRMLMTRVAEQHKDVIASYNGYALASNAGDLREYAEFLKHMGVKRLAHARDVTDSPVADDVAGQMRIQ